MPIQNHGQHHSLVLSCQYLSLINRKIEGVPEEGCCSNKCCLAKVTFPDVAGKIICVGLQYLNTPSILCHTRHTISMVIYITIEI